MIATADIEKLIGAEAVDPDNDRIGRISQVFVDADSDEATWVCVRTGLFGRSESVVPLTGATWDGEALHVAVRKARVKDAPRIEPEAELTPGEQERLSRYYGLRGSDPRDGATAAEPSGDAGLNAVAAGGGLGFGVIGEGDRAADADVPDRNDELGGDRASDPEGGRMRLRRYVVRQETVAAPPDELGGSPIGPAAGSNADDASTGMRMDDEDPTDPGLR